MPALRDFAQNYSSTTNATLICSAPDAQANDLLVAMASNDTTPAGTLYWMGGEPCTSAFLYDATNGFTGGDYTAAFNNTTASDWWLTSASPVAVGDIFYFGHTSRFNGISIQQTVGSWSGTIVWEYSQGGGAWATLTTLVNGIIPSVTAGVHGLVFNPPADWATDTVNSVASTYWVRMRITAAGTLTTRITCTQGWLGKWNQLNSTRNGTTAHHAILYKISGASEPEDYAIHDQQATNDTKNAMIVSVRDVDTNIPLAHATVAAMSYSESNQDSNLSLYSGSVVGAAQSFTSPAVAYRLASCKFYLKKTGSPTGNAIVKLYTQAAGVIPTTPTLAISNTYDVSQLTTSYQLIEFTFPWYFQYWMAASTVYCIGIEYSGGNGSNNIQVGYDNSSSGHAGNAATLTGSTWTAQTYDLAFYAYYFTYAENTAATGRFALPTMTTARDNSLLLYSMANAAASVPSIIEGPVSLVVGKDGSNHSDGMGWGFQKTAGTTPNNVYCSALGTSWTQCSSVCAVNPPSTGATVIPPYCSSDSSVYISPSTGAAYLTDAAPVVTATTYFGSTLNGKTLVSSGTTITQADTGLNSYHAMWTVSGVATAKTWSGNVAVVASRNLENKNILFHIQPYLPVDIQTTDSVSLDGACGVAIGLGSTNNNNYRVWHVGGTNTPWGVQRHVPVVVHSAYNGAGRIQNTGSLAANAVINIGLFVSGKVVVPDWLMGSIWALDTTVVAGGNAAEPLGVPGIVAAAADGHERKSVLQQGSSQFMIFQPLQIGDGGTNPVYLRLDSTALEFPRQYDKALKNVSYCSIDNVAGLTYYAGPADHIIHKDSVISSPSRYHWKLHTSSFINTSSVDRARSSNVATINTNAAHGLTTGNDVLVRGMADSSYNGTWTVASTPNGTRFTYNCTGGNEGTTADTGGVIGPEYDFSGLSVIGAGTISLARSVHVTGLTINNYSTLDMTGLNFDDGSILNIPSGNDTLTTSASTLIEYSSINITGVTAGNRWCSVASPVIFENNTFTGSASTGHAIRIQDQGTYSFIGNTFNNFGANGTNSAAIYNDSGGLVTLNISGTTSQPTYRNGTGASTVINLNVTLTIEIADADGNPISENCELTIVKVSDESVLFHEDNITDGSTAYLFNSGGGTAVYINVLNIAGYQNKTAYMNLPTTDTTTIISLDEDRFYQT